MKRRGVALCAVVATLAAQTVHGRDVALRDVEPEPPLARRAPVVLELRTALVEERVPSWYVMDLAPVSRWRGELERELDEIARDLEHPQPRPRELDALGLTLVRGQNSRDDDARTPNTFLIDVRAGLTYRASETLQLEVGATLDMGRVGAPGEVRLGPWLGLRFDY
jgi:hypothetical protein